MMYTYIMYTNILTYIYIYVYICIYIYIYIYHVIGLFPQARQHVGPAAAEGEDHERPRTPARFR